MTTPPNRSPVLSPAVAAALVACAGPDTPSPSGGVATVTWGATVPNAATLHFTTEATGVPYAVITLPEGTTLTTPKGVVGTEHAVPLRGLPSGTQVEIQPMVEVEGDVIASPSVDVLVPSAPWDLPTFAPTVSADPASEVVNRHVLATIVADESSFVVMLDGLGRPVWYHRLDPGYAAVTARPTPDGQGLRYGTFDWDKNEDLGRIVQVNWDGVVVADTRVLLGHHDFVDFGDGNLGWLALDFREIPGIDGTPVDVASDRVFTAPEGSDILDPTELVNLFDQGGLPLVLGCEHQQKDFDRYGRTDLHEWTHTNSLVWEPNQDRLYTLSKYTDTLMAFDRTTGDRIFQLGGAGGEFTGPSGEDLWASADEAVLFSHGHLSQLWEGGALVFDNGDHLDPPVSGLRWITWDETARTASVAWEVRDRLGRYTVSMGDARFTPEGHVLAAWATLGLINEVSLDGNVLWEVAGGDGAIMGRVRLLTDLWDLAQGSVAEPPVDALARRPATHPP